MNLSTAATEGMELLRKGQFDDACRVLEQGLAKDPKDIGCLINLARAHLARGKDDQARPVLERVLQIDPQQSEARSHLARFKASAGDKAALETLRELASAPGAGFPEQFNLASGLSAHGDLAGAEAALEKAIAIEPNSPYAHYELGRIALNRNDPKKALSRLNKAAKLAPNESQPKWLKARAQAALGDVFEAIFTLTEALKLSPKEPVLLEDMVKYYLLAGAPESAAKTAEQLRALQPDNANAAHMHGIAMLTWGKPEESRDILRQALALAPQSWEVRQALAQVLRLLNDDAGALPLLEEASKSAPAEPGIANDLALIYLTKGEWERAAKALEPALAVQPNDPGMNLNMALALHSLDPARAVEHAKKAQASPEPGIRDQAVRLVAKLEKK